VIKENDKKRAEKRNVNRESAREKEKGKRERNGKRESPCEQKRMKREHTRECEGSSVFHLLLY